VTITLTNQDTIARSAGIARLVGDHTVDEFRKVVSKRGGPIPDWIEDGGGVYTVPPGETKSVTQVLAPGKYAISDDETTEGDGEGESLADLGAKGEFTVTGPASDAELPAQPATLTAKDYSYEFKGFKAGKNMVRFEHRHGAAPRDHVPDQQGQDDRGRQEGVHLRRAAEGTAAG